MKIMTLNLHCFQEEKQIDKFKAIAKTIVDENIDIVLFQEVAQKREGNDLSYKLKEDNAAIIIKKLILEISGFEYDLHFMANKFGFEHYEEGLAIISKTKLINKESFYISKIKDKFDWKTRIVVKATTIYNNKYINLFSCHLGWTDSIEVYEDQFVELDKIVRLNEKSDNVINSFLGGDFNVHYNSKEYNFMMKKGYKDLCKQVLDDPYESTFNQGINTNKESNWRIDYLLSSKSIEVKECKILFKKNLVSDHNGVMIILEKII